MRASRHFIFAGFFMFLFTGIIYTQVTSRLPAVKAQTGISDADVGIALMCMGGGSLAGFLTVNLVLRHLQVRTLLQIAAVLFLSICIIMAMAENALQLFVLFALWGWDCAYLDVCMNTHAIYVEMKAQKPCMSTMHAGYSAGCLIGSALGSLFAFMGVPLLVNFCCAGAILLTLLAYFSRALLPDPLKPAAPNNQSSEEAAPAAPRRFVPFFVVFCGLMGLFSYTAEGSVAEWGSLVLHEAKHASEGTAALAYGTFALFMAAARFGCDHLRARIGDRKIIIGGGAMAFCALSLVIVTDSPYICLIAYAFMGIGLAPVFPTAISNAGKRRDVSPKAATAAVSLVGYAGLLIVPPCLGFLAAHVGLEMALLLPLTAVGIVIAGAFAFEDKKVKWRRLRA